PLGAWFFRCRPRRPSSGISRGHSPSLPLMTTRLRRLSAQRGHTPTEMSTHSDHSLLRRLRTGDQDAATQLYLRYAQRLQLLAPAECSAELARRVDMEDIVQSVFCSFFRGVSDGYYDIPAGEELWKLLLVIALNKIRAKGAFHRAARRDVRQTVGGDALAN